VDPDPLQLKVIGWIRNHINFQMTGQNVLYLSLFEHFFKCLSLNVQAMIWIQIRIMVKSRIRIRIRKSEDSPFGYASNKNQNPDLHQRDEDPQQLLLTFH
jgi:hypothetical protein